MLGLVAFSKLLASDNSVDTISLHHLYIKFLEDEMNDKDSENQECAKHLLKNGFTKFVSNRFGRLASLSGNLHKMTDQVSTGRAKVLRILARQALNCRTGQPLL